MVEEKFDLTSLLSVGDSKTLLGVNYVLILKLITKLFSKYEEKKEKEWAIKLKIYFGFVIIICTLILSVAFH